MKEVEITRISFPHFEPIYVLGEINPKIKKQIQVILNSLSFDPYAGYSPSEQ
jgi:Txe/YoeB family toxin of Txe-Axe toxin-antitoxin module